MAIAKKRKERKRRRKENEKREYIQSGKTFSGIEHKKLLPLCM